MINRDTSITEPVGEKQHERLLAEFKTRSSNLFWMLIAMPTALSLAGPSAHYWTFS